MPITTKSKQEIDILREGGKRLAEALVVVVRAVKPGVTTFALDEIAERLILEVGGRPAFKGYRVSETRIPFPGTLCVSVNDEVVHGIPRKDKILKEGDIVGLDIGMLWPSGNKGFYTDMAVTVGVGEISKEAEQLVRVTKEALDIGIRAVKPGAHVGDIGYVIEQHLKKEHLGIIRDLAGHGVGYKLHEEPLIPNYGYRGTGPELKEGMVIAIEPMATLGDWRVALDDDEWTFRTADGSWTAHFEHTVAVTNNGGEIVTR